MRLDFNVKDKRLYIIPETEIESEFLFGKKMIWVTADYETEMNGKYHVEFALVVSGE